MFYLFAFNLLLIIHFLVITNFIGEEVPTCPFAWWAIVQCVEITPNEHIGRLINRKLWHAKLYSADFQLVNLPGLVMSAESEQLSFNTDGIPAAFAVDMTVMRLRFVFDIR